MKNTTVRIVSGTSVASTLSCPTTMSSPTTASSPGGSTHSTATSPPKATRAVEKPQCNTPPTTLSDDGSAQAGDGRSVTVIRMSAEVFAALLHSHVADHAGPPSPQRRVSKMQGQPVDLESPGDSLVSGQNEPQCGIHAYYPNRDTLTALITAERDDSGGKPAGTTSRTKTNRAPATEFVDHSFDPQYLPCHKHFYRQKLRVVSKKGRTGRSGRKTNAKAEKKACVSFEEPGSAVGSENDRCEGEWERATNRVTSTKDELALPPSVTQTSLRTTVASGNAVELAAHQNESRIPTDTSPAASKTSSSSLNCSTRFQGDHSRPDTTFQADNSKVCETGPVLPLSTPACFNQQSQDKSCYSLAPTPEACHEDNCPHHGTVEEAKSNCAHEPVVIDHHTHAARPPPVSGPYFQNADGHRPLAPSSPLRSRASSHCLPQARSASTHLAPHASAPRPARRRRGRLL